MKVALHACCGPCLLEPLDDLASAHEVVVIYANPNISPAEEYERRKSTLAEYAASIDATVVELAYDPTAWERAVAGLEDDQPARCAACYRVRFGMVAEYARDNGFAGLASTLTVSPYQDAESIRAAGEEVAARAGVTYLHRDYRPRYAEATRRSRELEMYRQNYCGCVYSKAEAEAARAERRARATTAAHAARGESEIAD